MVSDMCSIKSDDAVSAKFTASQSRYATQIRQDQIQAELIKEPKIRDGRVEEGGRHSIPHAPAAEKTGPTRHTAIRIAAAMPTVGRKGGIKSDLRILHY